MMTLAATAYHYHQLTRLLGQTSTQLVGMHNTAAPMKSLKRNINFVNSDVLCED